MAKHFIRKDNHIVEMSEKEYQTHQGKKSIWYLLIFIVLIGLLKTCMGDKNGSTSSDNDSIENIIEK